MHAGRTGQLDVALDAGEFNSPACERVAAASAWAKDPPVQRLSWGSGALTFVRQRVAVDGAPPSKAPRHAEVVPDARGRQGCAQVSAVTDRAEGLELVIVSWIFPRFVEAVTLARGFVLGEHRGRRYRGGGLWDPKRPIEQSDQTPTTCMC